MWTQRKQKPPPAPTTRAAQGSYTLQPAQRDTWNIFLFQLFSKASLTMPARAPLRVIRKLHFPSPTLCQRYCNRCTACDSQMVILIFNTSFNLLLNYTLVRKRTDMPPVEAPRIVLTIARATTPPSPSFEMVVWDPPLKARNPKMRMKPPSPARGTE